MASRICSHIRQTRRETRIAALERLPLELWREVFEYISDSPDLSSAALLSRVLQREAEAVLYRIVDLQGYTQLMQFAETVTSCSRRASSVRALKLIFEGHRRSIPWEDVGECGNTTLKVLHGLKALHVAHHATDSCALYPGLAEKMFEGCTFQLSRFTSQFMLDDAILGFLAKQPGIEDLHILPGCDWIPPFYIPADVLPHLRILSTDMFAVGLRGSHNVTHLSIQSIDSAHVHRTLELFGQQLVSLKLARCDLYDWREYALPFTRHRHVDVPRLKYIECCIRADEVRLWPHGAETLMYYLTLPLLFLRV